MKIDNSIERMEEALKKKKELRASKDKAKLVTLENRIKIKTEKITKLQDDLANTVTEMETVKARIEAESGAAVDDGTKAVGGDAITNPPKPGPADEAKTEAFDPSKPGKSSDKRTATRKKQ